VKWNKMAVVTVLMILAGSYIYSALGRSRLSKEVETNKLALCSKQSSYGCELVSKYHGTCFDTSYRAEFRTKSFYQDEYNKCMDKKISEAVNPPK